jgi:hypothetical protein
MAEPDYELNRTAGIRANGNKVFEIEFTGQKLYELLCGGTDTAWQIIK